MNRLEPLNRLRSLFPACCVLGLVFLACGENAPPDSGGRGGGSGSPGKIGGNTNAVGGGDGGSNQIAGGGMVATGGVATGGTPPVTGGSGGTNVYGGSGGSAGGGGGSSVGTGCTEKTLCWDFEGGVLPQGFTPWRTTGTGQLLVDDTKPFGGTGYSLHAKDLQGGPQHTLKYVLPANFGPVMWGRLRMFTTPTRPEAHAGFFNARYPKPGQPDNAPEDQLNWYEVASYQQKYMSIWHPPWPPGFPEDVQVSGTMLALDKWTCVEWLFDGKNDADAMQAGLPKMWLDGAELAWPEHFTYSEPAGAAAPFRDKVGNFTVIELGIVTWQDVPTPTSWWIDDVVLGTERIGCN